ncbi:MAG: hypothetical protein E7032_07090 [Akkermansiaceae bacterium]|nr:hypothetical protein [Akkermansiaceae bacterium]
MMAKSSSWSDFSYFALFLENPASVAFAGSSVEKQLKKGHSGGDVALLPAHCKGNFAMWSAFFHGVPLFLGCYNTEG